MILHAFMFARYISRQVGLVEDTAEIQALGFPVRNAFLGVQQLGVADQIVKLFNAQLRHQATHFFGYKEEIVNHMLWLALELGAQHRVLRGHAHGASVEVAFAHHDAAFDDERCGGKAHFVSAQQRGNHHVAARFHLAVGLHADAAS